ncbi:MAG: hypothetical protein KDC27_17055 [Acidobacteria bacterium]|nr:hypothetical protein [Acidobacteriota bacterium]
MTPDRNRREKILQRVSQLVETKFFDPDFDSAKWQAEVAARRDDILDSADSVAFEQAVHDLLQTLGKSHTAFFHRNLRPVPSRQAICATLNTCETPDGPRLMFADVQEEGPAQLAGIEPGDLLLSINGEPIDPSKPPHFRVGSSVCLGIAKGNGHNAEVRFEIPNPKSRQPFTLPKPVVHRTLPGSVGYLKVNIFPGLVGIDVARDIDHAIASLQDCRRLIVDLRGNSGGGLGALRLMSYLTADRRPIGYSLTRARAQRGYDKERLVRFVAIPSSKWQLPLLALRYAFRDHSIVLVTEGLGPRPFHGRIAILVNQHSASAAEMIAAFAQENGLARIVGVKTPGRLVGSRPFKLPDGYVVILPVGAYLTWSGQTLEGKGVQPDAGVELSYETVSAGQDPQLDNALRLLE